MAEKGFGVKEVNLIGASGTPTITSPNNLNLNAVNVAISTNVSIGGTLTYEDVTNIDSVGLITAREGIKIPDDKHLRFGTDNDTSIVHSGTNTTMNVNGNYFFQGNTFYVQNQAGTKNYIRVYPLTDGRVEIYNDNNKKFETSSSGATVTGTLTATTFSGSGASLTNLPAANLTGTLPAISGANLTNLPATDPTNSDIQVVYTVTANGSSAYRFAGNGVVSTADDPDLYLMRGQKYRFINNSGGSHPFQIRVSSGGSAYSTGVTNNGAASGNIDFAPTYDSPAQLVYQCTSHSGMVGNIYLRGGNGNATNVGITTFANITANNINGNVDINVGTGEADIYSTGSGDQLSLRLLNSDASAGNKIGIYFGPANNVAGAYIKGTAESDFSTTANRDAGLEFGTRLNGNFLAPLKISAAGYVTKPNNVLFHAEGGPNTVSSANIVFSSVIYNVGSGYNNSTGKFAPPIAGYYAFYFQVYRNDGSDDSNASFMYTPSGGSETQQSEARAKSAGAGGYTVLNSHTIYYMNLGDTMHVKAGSPSIHCNSTLSYFEGYLIG